jgi:hypothetical protein
MHDDLMTGRGHTDGTAERDRADGGPPMPVESDYASPTLTVLGTLSELTAGGGVVFDDGAGLAGGSGTT